MLCDYGVPRDRAAGVPLSRIYMANIIGATAGPLVTGFVLFDLVPVATLAVWLGAAGVLIGSLLLALARDRLATAVSLAALALIPAVSLAFYGDLLERLHYKAEYQTRGAYTMTVETRTGIVAVEETPLDDIVYGGGFYDGGFNLDPVLDVNGITRPYMATAVHEAPADVLMIGLGSGSWTIATLASPRVRHLTVVELNRAHAEVIKQHPTHAALLSDPRLEVVIDDGRRWLQRHPDRRFDLVIMNTVLFWRNLSTNVLSHEFFTLVRSRLRDGGAVWFNGTGYDGSIFTVAHAFRHVTRFDSMVGASDRSFEASPLARRTHLWQFRLGDAPVFRVDDAGSRAVVERLASADLPDVAPAYRARSDLLLTTDDNMAPEYKDGLASLRSLFNRDKRWSVLWNSD
jgi:spermidine synthase